MWNKIKDFLWHEPTEDEQMDCVYGAFPPIPNLIWIICLGIFFFCVYLNC